MFGLPLIRGRFFSEDDVRAALLVMVVNQAFVHRYFPGEDPLGRRVKMDVFDRTFSMGRATLISKIIGLWVTTRLATLTIQHEEYLPEASSPIAFRGIAGGTYMARTASDPTFFSKPSARKCGN